MYIKQHRCKHKLLQLHFLFSVDNESITFVCNHLTNFALLVTGELKAVSLDDTFILSTISYVGNVLSILAELIR